MGKNFSLREDMFFTAQVSFTLREKSFSIKSFLAEAPLDPPKKKPRGSGKFKGAQILFSTPFYLPRKK